MRLFRKRKAVAAEDLIRIRINTDTPDVYKLNYREYLLTTEQAFDLFDDLRAVLEGAKRWHG